MPVDIRVPGLGESVVEGTVLRWYKQVGDSVSVGDALAELETDKVTVDIPAERNGVLQSITKGEGETASVGDVLGTLEEQAEGAVQAAAPASGAAALIASPTPVLPVTPAPAAPDTDHVRVTPLARKLAEEHGVNPAQVEGSGPIGRVRRSDVEQYLTVPTVAPVMPALANSQAGRPVSAFPELGAQEERVTMTRRRRTIAQRLVEARATAAMLTTFNECDLTAIMDLRKRRRDSFKERYAVSLGFMSFFTRAAVGALKAYPRLNAEIRGDDLIVKRHYDIGVAVDTEEGLVVPVVRNADRLSFVEIERTIADLAKRAREGKLSISDLQGGTFTVTNGGVFGSLFSTPIINMPQAAILGMHRIQERPVALNGQVVIRSMMYLALTYDHRIVDGREAVQFLVRIKELVEDPELLLTEA
ncbi:MAG TPA: 2-oxoglutarate dehydrogenase complex dihydrolipoyllysine-residue succinyltransferase [Chloroflexota bacterium]|jgi:2-oxoglutarate dehydrogenase E2 component (dihydrolipoamide succinyltransferase)